MLSVKKAGLTGFAFFSLLGWFPSFLFTPFLQRLKLHAVNEAG